MSNNLTGQFASDTYGRLVQVIDGNYYDGFGNPLTIGGGGTGSGTSGTSGTSGGGTGSGTSGTSGTNGTSGTSGATGSNGTSGTSGTNGTSGATGSRGATGSQGATGSFNGNIATFSSITATNSSFTNMYLKAGLSMSSGATINFNNGSFIGTGLTGISGIALNSESYEWKWEAGEAYLTDLSGYIRLKQYARAIPSATDDFSKGFVVDSLWYQDQQVLYYYICTDATIGAAVWEQRYPEVNLQQVTNVGATTTNTIIIDGVDNFSEISSGRVITEDKNTGNFAYITANGELGLKNATGIEGYLKNTNMTAAITLEFPDKINGNYTIATTEDIPSISGLVPYAGANDNVNIYPYNLTAGNLYGENLQLNGTFGGGFAQFLLQASPPTTGGTGFRLYANNQGYPAFKDTNGKVVSFNTNSIGSIVELTIPNADGTIALTNNVINSISAVGPITRTTGVTPIISTSMSSNRLIGRYATGSGVMQEVTIGSGLTLTGAGVLNNTATPTPLGYYGAWQDVQTQTASASNVGYPFIFRTIDLENQVRVVSNGTNLTRITFDNTGIYNLQFSAQIQNVDNAQHDVSIWIRKNGVDVDGSAGFVSVPPRKSAGVGNEGHTIAGWNYLLSIVAGEYYEIVWSTTNATNVTIQYYAGTNPPPSTASVLATVTQQSGIMAGTGITAINNLIGTTQSLIAGTAGTNFTISSTGSTHTFNLPTASATNRGLLSSADWIRFDSVDSTRKLLSSATGSVTGTTAETILTTLTIPANILDTRCFIWTTLDYFKTNSGSCTLRLYVNSSNSLSGATLIGLSSVASNRNVSFNRKLYLNGTTLDFLVSNTGGSQVSNEFVEGLFVASTTITVNTAANIFLIYTTQNDAVGTVATNKMATLQKMKLS